MNKNLYGKYKDVRNSAWQVILDYNINKLPIKITDITKGSNIKIVKNSDMNMLEPNMDALTIFDGEYFFIIYDDDMNIQRRRFTIAHELGHIFLGHFMETYNNIKKFSLDSEDLEKDANNFAIRLLAPACVLWGIGVTSPQEISELCNISLSASNIRFNRLQKLYERNMFLTSFLERRVFEQFKEFIEENKKINNK